MEWSGGVARVGELASKAGSDSGGAGELSGVEWWSGKSRVGRKNRREGWWGSEGVDWGGRGGVPEGGDGGGGCG